eukprot:jgi/Mesvir1/1504/Mv14487-RA.1
MARVMRTRAKAKKTKTKHRARGAAMSRIRSHFAPVGGPALTREEADEHISDFVVRPNFEETEFTRGRAPADMTPMELYEPLGPVYDALYTTPLRLVEGEPWGEEEYLRNPVPDRVNTMNAVLAMRIAGRAPMPEKMLLDSLKRAARARKMYVRKFGPRIVMDPDGGHGGDDLAFLVPRILDMKRYLVNKEIEYRLRIPHDDEAARVCMLAKLFIQERIEPVAHADYRTVSAADSAVMYELASCFRPSLLGNMRSAKNMYAWRDINADIDDIALWVINNDIQ